MAEPVIVAVAPNGARRTAADHPALPLTPEALAREAVACAAAGACLFHLHVRDAAGRHSLDPGRYREAISAIREAAGDSLLIQVTSEAAGRYGSEEQRDSVRTLMPEAVSLAIRELMPDRDQARETGFLLRALLEAGCLPQLIVYHPDDLRRYRHWQAEGLVPDVSLPLLLVLGRFPEGTLENFLREGSPGPNWMACAFGEQQLPAVLDAAAKGGHVRVGFENGLELPDGRRAPGNAALVDAAARALRSRGRSLANAATCRALMRPVAM